MLKEKAQVVYNKELKDLSKEEIYFMLLDICKEMSDDRKKEYEDGKKKLYYILSYIVNISMHGCYNDSTLRN